MASPNPVNRPPATSKIEGIATAAVTAPPAASETGSPPATAAPPIPPAPSPELSPPVASSAISFAEVSLFFPHCCNSLPLSAAPVKPLPRPLTGADMALVIPFEAT